MDVTALSVAEAAKAIRDGALSVERYAEALLERCTAHADLNAFITLDADRVRAAAKTADRARSGGARGPLHGVPLVLKDNIDTADLPTSGGTPTLRNHRPKRNAPVAEALLRAGALVLGKTNLHELACGVTNNNGGFGPARNPWDRRLIPGGSSGGTGVAVAARLAPGGIGTDTGGSVRIPAALCGLAGFKPTARRVPLEGAFPLSFTLDSVGPLANSIGCCAAYDAVLSGEPVSLVEFPLKGLRLLVPRSSMLSDLDEAVERAFGAALERVRKAGAIIEERPAPVFDRRSEYFARGGFAAAEAYHVHRPPLARLAECDPRVSARILLGKDFPAADYVSLREQRVAAVREFEALAAPFDALVLPTVACVAPGIAEAGANDEDYARWNLRILRNPAFINFLDGCAATLPCHAPGSAPVGFMVCGPAMSDRRILAVAAAVERALSRH